MLVLGIESTCDETAAAVVRDGTEVLSNAVATQFQLHEKFRGVVPEIAARAHIENILPVIREATDVAGVPLDDLDAIAVSQRPGLIGSLLVGVTAAKTLAWALGKPLVAVDHVQAHLYSVMLEPVGESRVPAGPASDSPNYADASAGGSPGNVPLPAIGLVCSGGHTALYLVRSWDEVNLIGATIDDAVGEAYDKVAAMLGLPFPGGPEIDRLAAAGDAAAYRFPRSMLGRDSLDFSFSGLKTAVRYQVFGYQGRERTLAELSAQQIADVAASFQAACIETLIAKIERAVRRFAAASVIVGGGVAANRALRAALQNMSGPGGAKGGKRPGTRPVIRLPAMPYCTDNAAMIAGLGSVHLAAGRVASLDLDAVPQSAIPRL